MDVKIEKHVPNILTLDMYFLGLSLDIKLLNYSKCLWKVVDRNGVVLGTFDSINGAENFILEQDWKIVTD